MKKPDKITTTNTAEIFKAVNKLIPDEIITTAEKGGHEIYAIGGCIRDLLMGRGVIDIDLSVVGDAPKLARDIASALKKEKIDIYARFGTALLRHEGFNYEFATARSESYSDDSRKPASIIPVSIDEDLKRRDFTINTLAIGLTGSRKGDLLDHFNGINDLSNRIIKTPLNPAITFADDPLRMLRGIRFAAEFGFEIEPSTWNGILNNLHRLKIVAWERIGDEFWKMLSGTDPTRAITLLLLSGIMDYIAPEVVAMAGVEQVGRHHHKDVLKHSLRVMQNVVENSDDPVVRLAGLLHDVGKPATKKFITGQGWTFHAHETIGARIVRRIGRRLGIGKENLNKLTRLVRLHMRPVNLTSEGVTDSAIRRLMVEAGEYLDDQLILCRADITTANPKLVDRYLLNFDEMARRMNDVEARDKMRSFQSPIGGEEIMKICDLEPGPIIGALKGRIEDAILDGVITYDYDATKKYLLKIKDEVQNIDPEQLKIEIRNRSVRRRRINGDFEFPEHDNNHE